MAVIMLCKIHVIIIITLLDTPSLIHVTIVITLLDTPSLIHVTIVITLLDTPSLIHVTIVITLLDTPSRSNWDEDDYTPPQKSAWDLPTPSSGRREDDHELYDRRRDSSSRRRDRERSEKRYQHFAGCFFY